jgi:phospholipid transport system transporter-binding protein
MMRIEGSRLALEGRIDMDSVPGLLADAAGQIGAGVTEIDLSDVTEADSAALALLLEWRRQAAIVGNDVKIRNLPGGLAALADLYGVQKYL